MEPGVPEHCRMSSCKAGRRGDGVYQQRGCCPCSARPKCDARQEFSVPKAGNPVRRHCAAMTAAARARHGARDKYELQQQATPIPAQQDLRAFRQSLILPPHPTAIDLMAWKRDDEQRAYSTRQHEGASDHEALHAHSSGIACCALESPCSLTVSAQITTP